MAYADVERGRIYYEVCDIVPPWVKNPETIIFHHGVAASLELFSGWLPVLASRYRLVRFDMRAFGGSTVPEPDFKWSFDVLVSDLLAVADAVKADRFHLVGESIGGTVAIAFALKHQKRLLSLTLSNAASRGGRIQNARSWRGMVEESGQKAWASQMMAWRFHPDGLPPDVHEWYLNLHATCSIHHTLGLVDLLVGADLTDRLKEIGLPVLLLCPDGSPFIAPDLMSMMRAELPDSEMQVFAHTKHGLPLSHGPEAAAVLAAFLRRRFG